MALCGDNINEQEIARLVKGGDIKAMKQLYVHYAGYLSAVCSRYITDSDDVRDLLHDAFLKIYSSIGSFEYRGDGSLRGWMVRILVNEALRFLKRNERLSFVPLTIENMELTDDMPEIDSIPLSVIHEMIRQLPVGYRTIFNLYVMEGKSHKEIAASLNIKESTSASQLHRAKQMLAENIKQYQMVEC